MEFLLVNYLSKVWKAPIKNSEKAEKNLPEKWTWRKTSKMSSKDNMLIVIRFCGTLKRSQFVVTAMHLATPLENALLSKKRMKRRRMKKLMKIWNCLTV